MCLSIFGLLGYCCFEGTRLLDGGASFLAVSLIFTSVMERMKFVVDPSGAESSGLLGGEGVASGRMD